MSSNPALYPSNNVLKDVAESSKPFFVDSIKNFTLSVHTMNQEEAAFTIDAIIDVQALEVSVKVLDEHI